MNSDVDVGNAAIRPKQQIHGVEGQVGTDDEEHGDLQAERPGEDRGAAKTRWKRMLDPRLPSQEDIDLHMMTHLPYRNWCEHCVKGRAKEMNHQKVTENTGQSNFIWTFVFLEKRMARARLRSW